MFFIQYLPSGTLRPHWYLVSVVDLERSLPNPSTADCRSSGSFYVDFFCCHPDDRSSSDACARWWRGHRYSTDSSDGTIIFGDQLLFRPNHTPNPNL
jgi:hypothetical protein